MRRLLLILCLFPLFLLFSLPGLAVTPWDSNVHEFKLNNGMRFLVVPHHQLPTFSVRIYVKVASIDQRPSHKDLTHRMQKLIMDATPWGDSQTYRALFEKYAAVDVKAMTRNGYTAYGLSMPAHLFELWAYLESNRLGKPANIQASKQLEHFYKYFYQPSNMLGIIVGNINPQSAERAIKRYFSKLKNRPQATRTYPTDVAQYEKAPNEVQNHTVNQTVIAYKRPPSSHPHSYAFDVLSVILGSGRSARFYRHLVEEKQLAVSVKVETYFSTVSQPNLFFIQAIPARSGINKRLEQEIIKQLEALKHKGLPQQELEKAKNQIRADHLWSLSSNDRIADQLAYAETELGGWRNLSAYPKKINQVQPRDIQEVLKKYFAKENRQIEMFEKVRS